MIDLLEQNSTFKMKYSANKLLKKLDNVIKH